MFFVFGTIMEFALVLNLDQAMRFTERLGKQDSDVLDSNKLLKGKIITIESHLEEVRQVSNQLRAPKSRKLKSFDDSSNDGNGKKLIFGKHGFTNRIDFISFFVFMFCYCIFNVIYAIKYTK